MNLIYYSKNSSDDLIAHHICNDILLVDTEMRDSRNNRLISHDFVVLDNPSNQYNKLLVMEIHYEHGQFLIGQFPIYPNNNYVHKIGNRYDKDMSSKVYAKEIDVSQEIFDNSNLILSLINHNRNPNNRRK